MDIKIYHLASCDTCRKILQRLSLPREAVLQNIKEDKITETQLDEMAQLAGSYEALFSKRSQKYRPMGLHEMQLHEADYRRLILEEYTFLKRPVVLVGRDIFIGNAEAAVAAAFQKIHPGKG